jgi:hypothetical protein
LRISLFGTWALALFLCSIAWPAAGDSIGIDLPHAGWGLARVTSAAPTGPDGRRTLARITLAGFSSNTSTGNPALPCRMVYAALPPDADLSSVEADASALRTTDLPGTYDIGPVPSIAPLDQPQATKPSVRDPLVYAKDAFYPREHVRVREVGRMRSWKLAAIEYWPYRYNPVSGRLRAVESGKLNLTFSRDHSTTPKPPDPIAAELSGFVANRDQALLWYGAETGVEPGYAIVTTRSIVAASPELSAFVDLQRAKGLRVILVTEDDWGGGRGDAAADNIREWLAANYEQLGLEYVLLIGDPHPITGDVPMKQLWPRYNQSSYRDAPSDLFYAELTGNWDRDDDGICGEQPDDFGPGGIDRVPDVYVGRIPCFGNIEELDHILRKTIDYQSAALGDWGRRLVLAMKVLDPYTPGYQLGEIIRKNIAEPHGLSAIRLYDGTYGLVPPPDHFPCDYAAVQDEWSRGAGFVFWMTHGGTTDAGGVIDIDRCEYLDDSRPAIVYQGSCSNGTPERSLNLAYSLLLRGAVSTVAASRAAWYYVAETDYTCSDSVGGIGYQYANYLIRHSRDCGGAFAWARLSVPSFIWPNQLVLNLYGDPALAYNRPTPGAISGIVSTIAGRPIEGATVRSTTGTASTTTRADGSYILHGLAEGTQDIEVSAPGFHTQRFYAVQVEMGKRTDLDVWLVGATMGSLGGRVIDTFGAPISDAAVSIQEAGRVTTTGPDGCYRFDGLAPGCYTVIASKNPYAQELMADCGVPEGKLTEVNITMRSRTGNAIRNGSFELRSRDGSALHWSSFSTPGCLGSTTVASDHRKYGVLSQKMVLPSSGAGTFVGVCQTVSVVPGKSYTLVAWARDDCDKGGASPNSVECRIGWDPTGGADGSSTAVVWVDFDPIHSVWRSLFKEVVPYAPTLTVFLEAVRGGADTEDECRVWFDGVSLMGPVPAPSVPVVRVRERYQSDTSAVSAEWYCSGSDVESYDCAVSITPDESGIVRGGGWTNVGLATSATRTGLRLAVGKQARVLVRVRNAHGTLSAAGASPPIRIVLDVADIASARPLPDGTWVRIPDLRVSRMGQGPECFLQQADRVAGIRARGDWTGIPYLAPGTLAAVVGRLASDGHMRVLLDAELMPSAVREPPRPLGMLCRCVGTGPNNTGLLACVVGRVTEAYPDHFVLQDGSTRDGLAVACLNSAAAPAPGTFVRVVGIAVPEGLLVCSMEDVLLL